MAEPTVVNIVGHLDFQRELDLSAVGDLLSTSDLVTDVEYNPAENHWLQSWFKSSETGKNRYVSFYRSGTAVINGCASVQEFALVSERVISVMKPAVTDDVLREVRNVVCTGDAERNFDLAALAIDLGLDQVEYEPELFPALIYRHPTYDCVFLVFSSGKIISTGLNDVSTAKDSIEEFLLSIESDSLDSLCD